MIGLVDLTHSLFDERLPSISGGKHLQLLLILLLLPSAFDYRVVLLGRRVGIVRLLPLLQLWTVVIKEPKVLFHLAFEVLYAEFGVFIGLSVFNHTFAFGFAYLGGFRYDSIDVFLVFRGVGLDAALHVLGLQDTRPGYVMLLLLQLLFYGFLVL